MASKKFAATQCAYCSDSQSTPTGDHILARQLVLVQYRAGIPKVPCCAKCNEVKSRLEHYLASVLPFGSRQLDAAEGLERAERRLAKNQRLLRELQAGHESFIDPIENIETVAVPLQSDVLLQYASWIAKGLLFYRWGKRVPADYIVRSVFPTLKGDALLVANLLQKFADDDYREIIANGALAFESLTSRDATLIFVWRFVFFEGAMVASSDGAATPFIWSFIGPPNQVEALERIFT